MPQTKVLVVEDTDTDAQLVEMHLRTSGQFAISRVETLADACNALEKNGIGCVILDLNLPDSMGFTTFTSLHSRHPETPVVILSGHEDEQLAVTAVAKGAEDYITKSSMNGPVLIRAVQYAIERNARRLAERKRMVIERDLAAARRVQQHLLNIKPPEIEGFDIAAVCRPADATGGDFFDFIPIVNGLGGFLDELNPPLCKPDQPKTACDIVIADVSSHGLGPALIMVGTRRMLRTCALICEDAGKILTIANRAVSEDTLDGQFVSVFYARLHYQSRTLSYSSAGHPAWLIQANGDVRTLKSSSGVPLGLTANPYAIDGEVTLESGDILLLITDGIWEARNPDGEQFGLQRVFECIHQHHDRTAVEIQESLLGGVDRFCAPHKPDDDVTMILIKATQ